MELGNLTERIIGAAMEVHTQIGPGLLESTYLECLHYELDSMNLLVERQKPLPLIYKKVKLDIGYRLDLLIERSVVVEIKCVEAITHVHKSQLLTYLKLTNTNVGLLINFNVSRLTDGLKRLVLSPNNP